MKQLIPYFLLILFGSFVADVSSQNLDFAWAKKWGGTSPDHITETVMDSDENLIAIGGYLGTVDFDPGPGTFNLTSTPFNKDNFVAKYNKNGELIWAFGIPGTHNSEGYIDIDPLGNIYVTGQFIDSADFDPGPGAYKLYAQGREDIFVAKYSPQGNFRWARSMGTPNYEIGYRITADIAGNVYTSGFFSSALDMDPGSGVFTLTPDNNRDVFLQKLDSSGNFVWAKVFQSSGYISILNLLPVDTTHLYIAGGCRDTVDFTVGIGSYDFVTPTPSTMDGFIVDISSSGSVQSIRRFQSNTNSQNLIRRMVLSAQDELIISGDFGGTADFDPGSGSFSLTNPFANATSMFVVKLDSARQLSWAKNVPANDYISGQGLAVDSCGFVYIGGSFAGNVDMDPGPGTYNFSIQTGIVGNIYMLKLNAEGNFQWARKYGNISSYMVGWFLLLDKDRSIYTGGSFYDTVDFDPSSTGTFNLTSAGFSDAFIHKMEQNPVQLTQTIHACDSFVSTKGEIWRRSGLYYDSIPSQGCLDTLISVNLTIGTANNIQIAPVICDSNYLSPSGRYLYTQSGLYTDTLVNASGCDSIITIDLTINPRYQERRIVSSCDSFRSPSQRYNWTLSGLYTDSLISQQGCDSLITIDLTVNYSSFRRLTISACDSFISPGGNIWRTSGQYIDTLSTLRGCDSIISIDLRVAPSDTDSLHVSACNSYQSPSGKYTWTRNGTYLDTLPNRWGCDSTLLIDLTVNRSSAGVLRETACGSFLSPSGKYTWYQSGTYGDTITNQAGCDSIMVVSLTINQANTAVVQENDSLTAQAMNASFQWIYCDSSQIPNAQGARFVPDNPGSYAVIVTQNGCTDTSACYAVGRVSLELNHLSKQLSVYPNPADDKLFIELGAPYPKVEVRLWNSLGQSLFYKPESHTDQILLDLIDLSPGLYYLTVSTPDGEKATRKIVRQ